MSLHVHPLRRNDRLLDGRCSNGGEVYVLLRSLARRSCTSASADAL